MFKWARNPIFSDGRGSFGKKPSPQGEKFGRYCNVDINALGGNYEH